VTQWRTPGGEPAATGDPQPADPQPAGPQPAEPSRGRAAGRQTVLLGVAGALIAAAVVLALVVTLGRSDGPAPGSPEAVADDFAAALRTGSADRVAELACGAARDRVARAARPVLGQAAARSGSAAVQGAVAVARLRITPRSGAALVGTLGLQQSDGTWCVQAFVAAAPVGG
jgi:hypothetical protein